MLIANRINFLSYCSIFYAMGLLMTALVDAFQNNLDELFMVMHFLDAGKVSVNAISSEQILLK